MAEVPIGQIDEAWLAAYRLNTMASWCGRVDSRGQWHCSLSKRHLGPHVAIRGSNGMVLDRWGFVDPDLVVEAGL